MIIRVSKYISEEYPLHSLSYTKFGYEQYIVFWQYIPKKAKKKWNKILGTL
jgi:hypothetical protein